MAYSQFYCSEGDVISVLSMEGVTFSVDDDRSGGANNDEYQSINDCIERAQAKINFFLNKVYDLTTLYTNTWTKWCCATFAAANLMRRRGASCPAGLAFEEEEYKEFLQMVMDNQALIPTDGDADAKLLISSAGLSMSNLAFDQRMRVAKVRYVQRLSTNPQTSKLPRYPDYSSIFYWQ